MDGAQAGPNWERRLGIKVGAQANQELCVLHVQGRSKGRLAVVESDG